MELLPKEWHLRKDSVLGKIHGRTKDIAWPEELAGFTAVRRPEPSFQGWWEVR